MIRAIIDFFTGYPTEIDTLARQVTNLTAERDRLAGENGVLRALVRALRDVNGTLDQRNLDLEPREGDA